MENEQIVNTTVPEKNKILNKYRGLLRLKRDDLTKEEVKLIRKAFNLSMASCSNKSDYLGEPYIYYVFGIIRIVASEFDLGYSAIASIFLYPSWEDGSISAEEIEKIFGANIFNIINGISKISKYDSLYNLMQSENYRKFILAISSDIRVILIKLAQRLYTMRRLNRFSKEHQMSYSLEVAQMYAPLAHRMGLYNLKSELEDIALKYTKPETYKSIGNKLRITATRRNRFIRKFIQPISEELRKQGYNFEIKGRTKSIHSIWNKMRTKDVEFEEIFDIFAIRIILKNTLKDERSDCWAVYSIVTNLYQPNPRRLRDWVSIPKSNGYESLHTTVVGPGGKWVEVQIRTERMNEIAEKGLAAHWRYKGGKEDMRSEHWLSRVREVLENTAADTTDFMNNIKLSLYTDEIFVFTPKGDIKKLPQGATVLDFAFDVHSDVGASCLGARVNDKNVTIKHKLNNGDTIEIITSKNQSPKASWLEYVVTPRARSKIKQILAKDKYAEAENGKDTVRRKFKNWKLSFDDKNVNRLLEFFGYKKSSDMYYDIASGKINLADFKEFLTGAVEKKKEEDELKRQLETEKELRIEPNPEIEAKKDDFLIIENEIEKVDYTLAKCCNPIFGDNIFGFITISEGIKIHRKDCPNAKQLMSKYQHRILNTRWTEKKAGSYYEAVIKIFGIDEIGIVNNISSVISKDLRVNMRAITFDSNNGKFNGTIKLLVNNTEHLDQLMKKLERVRGIIEVVRSNEE
jgi:GTP pyrophosphokinase